MEQAVEQVVQYPAGMTAQDKSALNEWAGFYSFRNTWLFRKIVNCHSRVITIFSGNRGGKTRSVAQDYALRILGKHPVAHKNIGPQDMSRGSRTFRFASSTKPNDPDGGSVKNTQYPAIKECLPAFLIKKDINTRNPVMTIRNVNDPARDIYIEFVSYYQDDDTQAGVSRKSIWEDECAPFSFHEEQMMRIIDTNGDIMMTMTPADGSGMGWQFDEIYEKARTFIRSKAVRDRYKVRDGVTMQEIETTDSPSDITVIMTATDDNPVLDKAVLDEVIGMCADEESIDIRRYGMFRRRSGVIFKDFDRRCHIIGSEKWFPTGIPHGWKFARSIDYHPHNNWACVFMALSPDNECFVWEEYNPDPSRMTTKMICYELALRSKDYKYALNLIDPLANTKQSNTSLTVLQDINQEFFDLHRNDKCTGGYWQPFDTKATKGRDEIRKRLKYSRLVGQPFSNRNVIVEGRPVTVPTIWFLDNCRGIAESMKNWRLEEWNDRNKLLSNDEKEKPQQKYSHFCTAIECVFKSPAWSVSMGTQHKQKPLYQEYFKAR